MMVVIEFFNVKTRGSWSKVLKKNTFLQVLLGTFLGLIPGCLGSFTIVSMYTHGILSFGALVATMLATFGDEAFIMFARIPEATIKITIVLLLISIIVGVLTNIFFKKQKSNNKKHFEIHNEDQCKCFNKQGIINNFKKISFIRAFLLFSTIVFLFLIITGGSEHQHNPLNLAQHKTEIKTENNETLNTQNITNVEEKTTSNENTEHKHLDWVKITFAIVLIIALLIITIVPEHFLEEHLWNHVIKKHFLKVLLWTFGVLLLVFVLQKYIDIEQFISNNLFLILIVAVLVGIIPESGPHLIFVSLFISGAIPLSILLANSVVQDGHGALPLFAEDKKSFVVMKIINLVVGFAVGSVGLLIGF
jgi:preprotein translocase subunit SecG